MKDDRRLSAPGRLSNAAEALDPAGAATAVLPPGSLAELAAKHGLRPSAERPPMLRYLRSLWGRRHFILAFATARNIAMYTEARLGQLWQILTPLLNAGVYFLIFGLLLHVSRGIPDYLGFLVTGVFVFTFTQRSFISSSRVITDSLPLIRALQFPRACLPLAYVIIELQQLLLSMVVLVVIILILGEPITWYWLLAIPALALQTVFNIGVGLFVGRIGAQVNDFSQLLPFLMRAWLYVSGVIFSITTLLTSVPREVVAVLQINPAALYITLVRLSLLASQRTSQPGAKPYNKANCDHWIHYKKPLDWSAYCHPVTDVHHYWVYGIGWAALALIIGFWYFWRAEAKYGRG